MKLRSRRMKVSFFLLIYAFTMLTNLNSASAQQNIDKNGCDKKENGIYEKVEQSNGVNSDSEIFDINYNSAENKSVKSCYTLIIYDRSSNNELYSKNADVDVLVNGAMVQMLTILVAQDYFSFQEVITVSQQIDRVSKKVGNLGLAEGNKIIVEDLYAGMLLRGATDAAAVIVDELEKRAQGESISSLLTRKAFEIGMTSSDYSNSDGIGITNIKTTANDQLILYLKIINNSNLAQLINADLYQVKSYSEKSNQNIAETIRSSISVRQESNKYFDKRIVAAANCEIEGKATESAYFYHVSDTKKDQVYLFWTDITSNSSRLKLMTQLVDIGSYCSLIDVTQNLEEKITDLKVNSINLEIMNWSLLSNNNVFFRYWQIPNEEKISAYETYSSVDISKLIVDIEPDIKTLRTEKDGTYSIVALINVNGLNCGELLLTTLAKVDTDLNTGDAQTTKADSEKLARDKIIPSPVLYSEADQTTSDTSFISRYGWLIITVSIAVVAIISIIIGNEIKTKMGQ